MILCPHGFWSDSFLLSPSGNSQLYHLLIALLFYQSQRHEPLESFCFLDFFFFFWTSSLPNIQPKWATLLERFICLLVPEQNTNGRIPCGLNRIFFSTLLEAGSPRLRCPKSWFLLRLLSLVYRWWPYCVFTAPFCCVHILLVSSYRDARPHLYDCATMGTPCEAFLNLSPAIGLLAFMLCSLW